MNEGTLISADNHWLIWAVLFILAAAGLRAEKTKVGSKLSAVVITILGGFILANLNIIPVAAPAYDIVWSYLVPLAIPLLLFKADLRRIIREAGPTLFAFIFGAIGTIIGTITAYELIELGEEGWKLAGIFSATYIGGSMNFVAVAEALQLASADLIAASIAADNLVMTFYFLVLFAIPSVTFFRKSFSTWHDDNARTIKSSNADLSNPEGGLNILNLTAALAIALSVCAAGFLLQDLTGLKGTGILFITALIVSAATLFPKKMEELADADQLGTMLMQVFFAVIGASASIKIVLDYGPVLFLFCGIILTIHLIFVFLAGKIFKLDLSEIVIASNANIGGPTTAAAMAVARKWDALVIPAVLCGTLGYATATFLGVALGYWLK
jgi:uncharacterized membrane protein